MGGRPKAKISGITRNGFVTSHGQPARIVIFQRNAALFKEFLRAFYRNWNNACLYEDLLLFHNKLTAPYCRGLLDYEMWIEDRLVLNNGSVESVQIAYDRINGRHFALEKIPADHQNQPLVQISVLLGAWGSLDTNVYGLQKRKDLQEIWLLLRIPDERIPLRHLFKRFLKGTGVNVDMLKRVLVQMYFRVIHFHTTGVSSLSLTEDSVDFCPNRQDFTVDFRSPTNVLFKGQPEFFLGLTGDLQDANSMIMPHLETMKMNRCLEEIHQKDIDPLETAHIILDYLTRCNDIPDQPYFRNSIEESNYRLLSNGRHPSDIILEIGDIKIREVDYRSLDSTVSENELEVIKKAFPNFKEGWLSDGVMIGFFMSLRKEVGPAVIVLTTSLLQKPVNELEREINIDIQVGLRWILVPWNPGSHWILIAVDGMERKAYCLDPDPGVSKRTFRHRDREVLDKVISLLKWKPDSIITDIPGRSKQECKNDNNCGVFVCFYVQQLVFGKSLGERIDPQEMRSYIRGKLLEHANYLHPSRNT